MSAARVILWAVFAGFSLLTIEVLAEFGYAGFVDWAFHNFATTLLAIDLIIALALVSAGVIRHAAEHGHRAWPYLLLTLAFGSAGPLLYFARHLTTRDVVAPRGAREAVESR
jgi:hypothetical protein